MVWIIISIIVIAIVLFCIWQDNVIVTTKINYCNKKIPGGFDGFVVVQVSDLHNRNFGTGNRILLKKIREISPDIIVVTGDLIDRHKYDLDVALTFIAGAVKIAPVYYVTGNHEGWSKKYRSISTGLQKLNVKVLDNADCEIKRGNDKITIIGLADPAFLTTGHQDKTDTSLMEKYLHNLGHDTDFKIALSHRPELFELYVQNGLDLVFSGHAHGGQFRLPLVGGLYAPEQGIFPQYTSGEYQKANTAMIVSRGLGNSLFPVRFNNRPELVVVILSSIS
mgnify:CR=1 FL=1